jgi:hypothetical protein
MGWSMYFKVEQWSPGMAAGALGPPGENANVSCSGRSAQMGDRPYLTPGHFHLLIVPQWYRRADVILRT